MHFFNELILSKEGEKVDENKENIEQQQNECPFRYRSMAWALYMEDFSDLTSEQIAEVFDVPLSKVFNTLSYIKKKTGKKVKYKKVRKRF